MLQVDLRRPRRPRPRDHPHRPRGRHVRGGAAAQGEVRGDLRGRLLRDRARRARSSSTASTSSCAAATSACSARTPTSTRSRSSAPTSKGPSIALITQSGHQGRPVFQGQEIGIRLTHWAPTGNEVDLEFADFARHFADQPEVGVIACYIEGFKDGRTLMLAADHAAKLRKPMVMVKVGKTEAGRSMAQSHTGHLTGSDAVTSRGVPPVRRDARRRPRRAARRVGRARAHPARRSIAGVGRAQEAARACACTRSRAAPARTWPTCSPTPGLRLPDLTKATQTALHDGLIPAYLARVEPGRLRRPARRRPPRRARSSTRSSPTRTSTSWSCRSPARSRCSASRSRAT